MNYKTKVITNYWIHTCMQYTYIIGKYKTSLWHRVQDNFIFIDTLRLLYLSCNATKSPSPPAKKNCQIV